MLSRLTTNPINQCGLIAGAIGGETMVLLVLLNTIVLMHLAGLGLFRGEPVIVLWNTLYPLFIIGIFEFWGIFAAWLAGPRIAGRLEWFLVGFITGIMIGVILEVMWFSNILSLLGRNISAGSGLIGGSVSPLITIGLLISLALTGGILSGFGSFIFVLAKKGWHD